MYGSFASGEADAYSDVEFWLFFDPGRRGEVEHWLTPSRCAERELPPAVLAELRGTTPAAHDGDVRRAIRRAWEIGRRCWTELAERHNAILPHRLFAELDDTLSAHLA